MERLGYTRYVAQGGDVGAVVTDAMGHQAPNGLVGIHVNLLTAALRRRRQRSLSRNRAGWSVRKGSTQSPRVVWANGFD